MEVDVDVRSNDGAFARRVYIGILAGGGQSIVDDVNGCCGMCKLWTIGSTQVCV